MIDALVVVPNASEVREHEAEVVIVWRRSYDQDRLQAKAEGRGCGRCIEGVVRFGPNEIDQIECKCEIAQKKKEPIEKN